MKKFLLFLLVIVFGTTLTIWLRYGGGDPYVDLSTKPLINASRLQEVLSYPEPIGNVVVSDDGRLFFSVHPESRPVGNKLLEWVAGAAVPYPNGGLQPQLFDTVLGLAIDRQQRLWTIDHGNQGFDAPRLLAFDLNTGNKVHDHIFASPIAPAGSFLQDLVITADGKTVIISDGSILRKSPALIVYDVATQKSWRRLESHESVSAKNYLIRTSIRDLSYLGGIFTLKAGVTGIALDAQNVWLYFAALSHDGLFRVPLAALTDPAQNDESLAPLIERYGSKPLSDGLLMGGGGRLFITDVEHNSISVIQHNQTPRTLLRSPLIRWPAAISIGPNGNIYIADSAFPELVLQTREHIKSEGPYQIFRIEIPAANRD